MPADAPSRLQTGAAPAPPLPASLRYAWYVVGVLTFIYIFSFIDRQIFSLLVGPLRHDLRISDTQVSMLQGISFALFFTLFGIPIGRATDLFSRRLIIALGLVAWSLFTASCGLAQTFPQMLLLRMGVGAGEAALSPAAYSLVADYFPRHRLATAISIYSMGIYIGSGLSLVVGGLVVRYASTQALWTLPLVGAVRSWQLIFFLVGLPGLALLPLIYTLRDPSRGQEHKPASATMREVFAYMRANRRTVLLHNIGFGLLSLSAYGGGAWAPEFLRRHFHWSIPMAGVVFGINVAVFGCIGITGAGRVADFLRSRGRAHANLLVAAVVAALLVPVNYFAFLAPNQTIAIIMFVPILALAAAPFGIAPAAIQEMMPPAMRGQASSIYLLIVNLIGLGLGPTAVAFFTQHVFKRDDAIPYSLAIVGCSSCALAAALLFNSFKPFRASLERLRVWQADHAA